MAATLLMFSLQSVTFGKHDIKLKALALGDVNLSSAPGKMLACVLAAAANLERNLLWERAQIGPQRAKNEGRKLGRRSKVTIAEKQQIAKSLDCASFVSSLAHEYGVGRASILADRREISSSSSSSCKD